MATSTAGEVNNHVNNHVEIFKLLDQIIWKTQQYKITELINLRINMPILTREISLNSVDSKQFCWLQERRTVKRVVAVDRHGNHIMFPLNCPILFKNLDSIGETENETILQSLDEVLENYEMPVKVKPCLDKLSFESATLNDRELPLAWFSDITLLTSYKLETILAVDIRNNMINPTIFCMSSNNVELFQIASAFSEDAKHTIDSLKEMQLQIERTVNFKSFTDNCSEIYLYTPKSINLAGPGRVKYQNLTCKTLQVVLKHDAYMYLQPKRISGKSKTLSKLTDTANDGRYSSLNVTTEMTKTKPLPGIPKPLSHNLRKTRNFHSMWITSNHITIEENVVLKNKDKIEKDTNEHFQDRSIMHNQLMKLMERHKQFKQATSKNFKCCDSSEPEERSEECKIKKDGLKVPKQAGTFHHLPTSGQKSAKYNANKKEPLIIPHSPSSGTSDLKNLPIYLPDSRSLIFEQDFTTSFGLPSKSFPGLADSPFLSRVCMNSKPLPSIPIQHMPTETTSGKNEKQKPAVSIKPKSRNRMSAPVTNLYEEVNDHSLVPVDKIQKASDIPHGISTMSEEQVIDCLHLLKMDRYKEQFEQNHIDGEIFSALDQEILTHELGLSKIDAFKVVKFLKERYGCLKRHADKK